jgi:hypothetical protein
MSRNRFPRLRILWGRIVALAGAIATLATKVLPL